jgi:ADP-ribose pyrophosphatase
MKEEKTLKSNIVYDGHFITVLKDDILSANGKNSFREIILHNGGVVIVALKEHSILFVKQYRYALKSENLELPAGKLEKNEDPKYAAQRELIEETGYKAKTWESLGYINTTPGICTEKLYLYLAKDLTFVGENYDEDEVIELYEYKLPKVLEMIKNGEINDAKTICAISRAFCKELVL